jgi:hypothetical protein
MIEIFKMMPGALAGTGTAKVGVQSDELGDGDFLKARQEVFGFDTTLPRGLHSPNNNVRPPDRN